ncbi:MAG: hypothetical protein EX285_08715 [Thaumarchaeota archaeon]|nr:hypothetical protein [Nitrososphaerota archaeon]
MKYHLILIGLLLIVGCSPKISNSQQSGYSESFMNTAYEAVKAPQVEFSENSTNDYVLCTYMKQSDVPGSEPLKIAVIEKETNKVTYKTSVSNGSVKWIDQYKLELISPPGIPNGNAATVEDYTYTIDVRTGQKSKKLNVKIKN